MIRICALGQHGLTSVIMVLALIIINIESNFILIRVNESVETTSVWSVEPYS